MLFATPELRDDELLVLQRIDELRTRLRHNVRPRRRWVGALRRQTFARNMKGSNSIEGYDVSIQEAVDLVQDDQAPMGVEEETAAALRGYQQAMTYVLQLADDEGATFAVSADLLKSLHYMMVGYDLDKRPGRWRLGPIYVHDEETGEQVYEGAPHEDVPELMEELVASFDDDAPAVVRAAMAHLNLVMIHPFKDGNGRMARVLQTMLLAQDGILEPEFCSVEEFLGRQTPSYYRVLAEVGMGSWQPQGDARPWVRYMLTAHYSQAATILRRLRVEERVWYEVERLIERRGLHERMTAAVAFASAGWKLRRSGYVEYAEVEEATATRDLGKLVESGLLLAHGEKRGRFYTASAELLNIRRAARSSMGGFTVEDPFELMAEEARL